MPHLLDSVIGHEHAVFYGWREDKEPNFIFCTFAQQPWLGIIIPISKDRAEVRRSFFNETDVNTLFELLSILEQSSGSSHMFIGMSSSSWRLLAKQAGLND
jgi:hypothetical protein